MADTVFRIKGWGEEGYYYEVSQNRRTSGALPWVAVSTKHDGKTFRRLGSLENGTEIYGAWHLILQVAAKCPTRGVLADEDGPLSAKDLSLKTGFPEIAFETAIKVLSSKEIGWLVVDSATARNGPSELRNGTERNETLRNVDPASAGSCPEPLSAAPVLTFPCNGPKKFYELSQAKLAEYVEAYPNLDVIGEFRKALQWLRDHPGNRKTHGGMPAFLGRWLAKATNGRGGTAQKPQRSVDDVFRKA